MVLKISNLDKELENTLFKQAKKDKVVKSLYEEYVSLKDTFSSLINNVQEQNRVKNDIKDLETKVEAFKLKYKNFEEMQTLEGDLIKAKADNQKLVKKLEEFSVSG